MSKYILIAFLVGFVAGAIFHERDIYNSCKKDGESGMSMWTKSIQCSATPELDQ